MTFLVIWLAGDFFNILGGVLQGILPTMIILAVYYTLADIVLILQVLYYRGLLVKSGSETPKVDEDTETQPLLNSTQDNRTSADTNGHHRSSSLSQLHNHVDATHLSPATPLHRTSSIEAPIAARNVKPVSTMQTILFNATAIVLVCAAGASGWWISTQKLSRHPHKKHHTETIDYPEFDTWGQVFGYFCAILYLGSRIPQILLNYQRKSTEGVSLLFFLFACIGNLTYDLSIFAYDPVPLCDGRGIGQCADGEAASIYARYIAVNASWITGSLGTLLLDMVIFTQFFLYRQDTDDESEEDIAIIDDGSR
jgi:solute carrier family 66 (lysosomal lysine-arginine transporter), member 1